METIDINNIRKIHFIGIGGVSMSAIADILLSKGYKVSGSDSKENCILDKLKSLGAEIHIGHRASNVADDTELVVYTAAISEDNEELLKAGELNIPVFSRAVFLGELMKDYKSSLCVSGTHGKTTTTSLISKIFVDAGTDPTINVGGYVPFLDGNLRIGKTGPFITEACEYTNSFLSFFPTHAVILNVKADHLDFFKDLDDIRKSFRAFAELLPDDGVLVINGEIDDVSYFTNDLKATVITFGLNGNYDYTAQNIRYDDLAMPTFDICTKDGNSYEVKLPLPGEHNIYNALAAVACSVSYGLDIKDAISSIEGFSGVQRRFEIKGKLGGATVIDDYAHHPDEISATLEAAHNFPHKKLWCVFQPHTYTRTEALLDDFAKSLSAADAVVLADIYAAREKNLTGISSKDLMKKLEELGIETYYFPTFDEIENFLLENLVNGDVLITMGAGDVVNIGDNLLGR